MTQTKKIQIQAGDIVVEGYESEEGLILLTHRQIGEVVGKSKAVAQRFLKQRENELPSTVKASIPDRKGKIPLTQWQSAKLFWQSQAEAGNEIALDLINAITDIPEVDLKVTTETINDERTSNANDSINNLDTTNSFLNHQQQSLTVEEDLKDDSRVLKGDRSTNKTEEEVNEVKLIAEGIEVASNWMHLAGIDEKAIAAWKLKELGKQIPVLEGVVNSALFTITSDSSSPTGMIVSQLAKEMSNKLGTKVTPAKINQALHDLELQEWAKPGVNRERKLTAKGKEYGIALLTTSADGWQGAQLRWYDSVIPLLSNYFSSTSD